MPLPWDTFSSAAPPRSDETVTIVGAGLAGCWLSRLLAERGVRVKLLDARANTGLGASGNPAGIFKPFVTRQPSAAMQFYLHAHDFLVQQLQTLNLTERCQVNACGVMQLTQHAYPCSEYFRTLEPQQSTTLAGTSLNSRSIHFPCAGWLNPHLLCQHLVQHPLIETICSTTLLSIQSGQDSGDNNLWHLSLSQERIESTRLLVLALGHRLNAFDQTTSLPVVAARGQISRFVLKPDSAAPQCVVSGKHYVIPQANSLLVGATFERDNDNDAIVDDDHLANLAGLYQLLPDVCVADKAVEGYAGIRATTPDRLPLIGPVPQPASVADAYASLHHGRPANTYPSLPHHQGLFVLGGLGSRGIVTAPLAAKALADHILQPENCDDPGLLGQWAPLFNPARFQIRALKRRYN